MTRVLVGLAAAIAYWLGASVLVGWAANQLSDEALSALAARWPRSRFEQGGGWYRRRLGIERWKDRLPEAGGSLGGRSKRRLGGRAQVDVLYLETMRAELVHVVLLGLEWVPLVWLPGVWRVVPVVVALAGNLPFIAIQRYNRARIDRLRAARSRRSK
jgi:glycosyl-4,4'-diaponeurosporenoate acyltransferase